MKKLRLGLLLCALLLMTGCSNKDRIKHNYFYKGESDLWDVYYQERSVETFYKVNGKLDYDCKADVVFTAVYKFHLSDLEKVKKIEIEYEAGSSKCLLSSNYNDDGPYSRAFVLNSSNGLVSNEDGVVKARLSIDGNSEFIELMKQ